MKEFGGQKGTIFIILSSHMLLYFMASTLYGSDYRTYIPTIDTFGVVFGYHIVQMIFAKFMPGITVKGMSNLGYMCNGYASFYGTLLLAYGLYTYELLDLTKIVTEYPKFLTTTNIIGNIYSVVLYMCSSEGNSIYDFFMGGILHPRISNIDIKMLLETRLSWTLLFLITLGGYLEKMKTEGYGNPLLFMVLAHWLYANACAKGEHFIPYTWDIFYEKLGWMLCFWNISGVPMLYSYQTLYLVKNKVELPLYFYGAITTVLLLAYWIWDECNYQKNLYKSIERREVINRKLFPTFRSLPVNPRVLKSEKGTLLIDGWYKYGRKIHYTADIVMALCWGLSCGFDSIYPYVYVIFFIIMIIHRTYRDEERCSKKYSDIWDKYISFVPYRFIPYVY